MWFFNAKKNTKNERKIQSHLQPVFMMAKDRNFSKYLKMYTLLSHVVNKHAIIATYNIFLEHRQIILLFRNNCAVSPHIYRLYAF